MGAKSTVKITKAEAINFIIEQLQRVNNETLERLVEELNDSLLYNQDFDNTLGLHNFTIED